VRHICDVWKKCNPFLVQRCLPLSCGAKLFSQWVCYLFLRYCPSMKTSTQFLFPAGLITAGWVVDMLSEWQWNIVSHSVPLIKFLGCLIHSRSDAQSVAKIISSYDQWRSRSCWRSRLGHCVQNLVLSLSFWTPVSCHLWPVNSSI